MQEGLDAAVILNALRERREAREARQYFACM